MCSRVALTAPATPHTHVGQVGRMLDEEAAKLKTSESTLKREAYFLRFAIEIKRQLKRYACVRVSGLHAGVPVFSAHTYLCAACQRARASAQAGSCLCVYVCVTRACVGVRTCVVSRRVPVLVTGGWRSRSSMEAAIENNECALIG